MFKKKIENFSGELCDYFEIKNQKISRSLVVFYSYLYFGIIFDYFSNIYLPIVTPYTNFLYDYFYLVDNIFDSLDFLGANFFFRIIVGLLLLPIFLYAKIGMAFHGFPLLLPKYIIKTFRWIYFDNYEYEKIMPKKKAPNQMNYFCHIIYEDILNNHSLKYKLFKNELDSFTKIDVEAFNKALIYAEIGMAIESISQGNLESQEDFKLHFCVINEVQNEDKIDFHSKAFEKSIFPLLKNWGNCQYENLRIILSYINKDTASKLNEKEDQIRDKIDNIFLKLLSDKNEIYLDNGGYSEEFSGVGEIIKLWHQDYIQNEENTQ